MPGHVLDHLGVLERTGASGLRLGAPAMQAPSNVLFLAGRRSTAEVAKTRSEYGNFRRPAGFPGLPPPPCRRPAALSVPSKNSAGDRLGISGSAQPRVRRAAGARGRPRAARPAASGSGGAGARASGAVARMNCSIAATTAAASSGEAPGATIESWGRRFMLGGQGIVPGRARAARPRSRRGACRRLRRRGDRARPRRAPALPRRRLGDAGQGLPAEPAATATSGRCRREATGWRCSSGSPRSRAIPSAACPPSAASSACRTRPPASR